MNWTAEQQLAVKTTGGDILLTAAAGSGKTSVLAQRCLHLLTDQTHPCGIDELLVMTYTDAAASEMRHRIAGQLNKYAIEHPSDNHIHKQIALLDKSQISTIHSFCSSVLHEFFYHIGINPNFEIIPANEADLLKSQIVGDLFEEYYGKDGQKPATPPQQQPPPQQVFNRFIRLYGANSNDRGLMNLLVKLHTFLGTLTAHENLAQIWQRQTNCDNASEAAQLQIVKQQKTILQYQLQRVCERLEYADAAISGDPDLRIYCDYIKTQLAHLTSLQNSLKNNNLANALEQLRALPKLPRLPNRPRQMAEEDVAAIKGMLSNAKDDYAKKCQKYSINAEELCQQMDGTGDFTGLLIELYEQFARRYSKAKQRQNVLDFSDLEHKCVQLLYHTKNSTNIAAQLRSRYKHILIDEYQDISPLQEQIIQAISSSQEDNAHSLFMVGDVKQSIYGFRQADPDIILKKYHSFTPVTPDSNKQGLQIRIDLNKNFRSHRDIINSVNYIFSRCMTEEFAGINYQKDSQLIYGANYDDNTDSSDRPAANVEVHLIESKDNSKHDDAEDNTEDDAKDDTEDDTEDENNTRTIDATRREAFIVGLRIKQMVNPENGKTQPVAYRDIVVLLRSITAQAEIWSEVFQQMGIPVHANLSSGYFVATEIQDMISLLKLLDNPQQDIPLATVLRSAIAGLSETQLTAIRLHSPAASYYSALSYYRQNGPDKQLQEKLKIFLEKLDKWRSCARQKRLAELIRRIYADTNLPAYVAGLSNGRQRYNNLLQLYDNAREFDNFTSHGQGLPRFLRFIEKLRAEEKDLGPAAVLTEADDVVQIMSVHKAKGLEFPVVIVAQLSRKFNKADSRGSILPGHPDICPVGMRVVDDISRDSWATLAHNIIADRNSQRQLAEEMRILYVALTRPKQRLIMTACIDFAKARDNWTPWRSQGSEPLPTFLLSSANAAIDWLGPAWAGHPDFEAFISESAEPAATNSHSTNTRFAVTSYDAMLLEKLRADADLQFGRPSKSVLPPVADTIEKSPPITPHIQKIVERIDWQYPYQELTTLPARASVTELKRRGSQGNDNFLHPDPQLATDYTVTLPNEIAYMPDTFGKRPSFMADESASPGAAERGTLTHTFLQSIELAETLDYNNLTCQLDGMVAKGVFTARQSRCIDIGQIERFFADALGKVMLSYRNSLQREWTFTLALPATEVYPQITQNRQNHDETVMLRGIIDCLIESQDGLIIIDYKTDNITKSQCGQRAEYYSTQMRLYRRAVETILAKPVRAVYLYFLAAGQEIEV